MSHAHAPGPTGPGAAHAPGPTGPGAAHAPGPTRPGSVILDIGEDAGALVVYTPAELLGAEIEIGPAGGSGQRTHSQVRERLGPGGEVSYAAVYPGVPAGRYVIWRDAETPAGSVTVTGGEVSEWSWADAHQG